MLKWLAFAAFLLWEAWWAYVFYTTPRPDYKWDTVLAMLCGIALPLMVAIIAGAFFALRAFHRPRD